jgi:chromosome segregation ATPase
MYNEQPNGHRGIVGASIGGIMGDKAVNKPLSRVDSAVEQLSSNINSLAEELDILQHRLRPVLGKTVTSNQQLNERTEEDFTLAGTIYQLSERLNNLVGEVVEMRNRLEI